ncbi:MAG TPA: exodeoxyribonuclease V subunit gamma [Pseudonocardia sp.]|nr:exodeoxyribonuclease V subunit gamma [Pseudonocardia sp.]
MLHVHRAERADALADALAELLVEPLGDPFTAEVVAVPAKGMERWLAQRLSHRLGAAAGGGDGVCAHIAFPSPARVVAEVVAAATGVETEEDPWRPARAVWPLLEVIDESAGEAWCAPLGTHLGVHDPEGTRRGRRYAAARHLAELFAGYAAHRPEMLRAWQGGPAADGTDADVPPDLAWQPELWRRLRERIGVPGPAERLTAAVAALRAGPELAGLPPRVSLFGPTRLPADHLAVLAALAEHREVHVWLPHPSPGLWDRVAAVAAPGVPRRREDPSAGTARHPLLASLGRDVRELQVRLSATAASERHHPLPAAPATLLGRLQADLRADRPPAGEHVLAPEDRSVQVHACHGPARQVEVLREVVLGLLAADPGLEPRDVLVMCPDIETFAPLVSACFGLEPGGEGVDARADTHPGQRLQVRLADRALRQVNPLLDVVERLLELAGARLTASQVLDLLAAGPVRRRFHLAEEDLERLRELAVRAGVRWGLDAAHRRPFRLDGFGLGAIGDGRIAPSAGTGPGTHPAHGLRVRLADRALSATNPLLALATRLVELAGGRVTATEMLDLVARDVVRRRFQLDDDDLSRIAHWVGESGVRWGLDQEQRAAFSMDKFGHNTWRAGIDRILVGVAMSGDDLRHLGTALPLDDVESGDVERVGRLAEFVDRLSAALASLSGEQPLARWVTALGAALDSLTATTPTEAWQGAQARGELAEAARAAGPHAEDTPLGLTDVRGLLAERLRGRPTRANFRTGSLTVCTMVPMRSVPHRVVCLLGLDDGVFPRAGVADGDDVLARDPRLGERDPRSEDRQLFLDAICAATEHLVVVHSGADERSGARRPPAVPLGELLDTIAATAGKDALDRVVVRHPLQPFDARNFVPGRLGVPGPFSFDRAELAGARAAAGVKTAPPPFLPGPLPPREAPVVELDELARFLEHPVREFLRQRVGLSTFERDEDPADALPVVLDALQTWAVGDRLLRDRLAGHDLDRCRQAEWRRGELPPGLLGHATLAAVTDDVEDLVAASAEYLTGDATSRDVDVELPDGTRVVGTVGGLHGDALVRVEYSRLAAKHRVRAWARLLALAAGHPGEPWRAVTVGRGFRSGISVATTGPVDPGQARAVLADLVALHREGLCEPLPLPGAAALVYARTRLGGGSAEDALAEAEKKWCGGGFPERDDAPYVRAFGPAPGAGVLRTAPRGANGEPSRFAELSMRLWEPLLAAEDVR